MVKDGFLIELPQIQGTQFTLQDFEDFINKPSSPSTELHSHSKKMYQILASKACHTSLRVGDILNNDQMTSLLQ